MSVIPSLAQNSAVSCHSDLTEFNPEPEDDDGRNILYRISKQIASLAIDIG